MSVEGQPIPDTAFSRRELFRRAAGFGIGVALAGVPQEDIEAWQRRIDFSRDPFSSLHAAEAGSQKFSDKEKRAAIGELAYQDLPYTSEIFFDGGLVREVRFSAPEGELPSISVRTEGDPKGSLAWIQGKVDNQLLPNLAIGQPLTYNIPIIRTPHYAEQRVPLQYTKPGEVVMRFSTTVAGEDIQIDDLDIVPQVLRDPSPMQNALLLLSPTVAVQVSNFLQYYKEGATDEEKYEALMNDTTFFENFDLFKTATGWMYKFSKGDVAEREGTPPLFLNAKYDRMYDVDEIVLAWLNSRFQVEKIAGQQDVANKDHQIITHGQFDPAIDCDDPRVKELLLYHSVEGHGMSELGIQQVSLNGDVVSITDVVAVEPTIISTTKEKTAKAQEIELVKKLVAVQENQRKVLRALNVLPPDSQDALHMQDRGEVLLQLEDQLNSQIARLAAGSVY